jgi:hypothetical protein
MEFVFVCREMSFERHTASFPFEKFSFFLILFYFYIDNIYIYYIAQIKNQQN